MAVVVSYKWNNGNSRLKAHRAERLESLLYPAKGVVGGTVSIFFE